MVSLRGQRYFFSFLVYLLLNVKANIKHLTRTDPKIPLGKKKKKKKSLEKKSCSIYLGYNPNNMEVSLYLGQWKNIHSGLKTPNHKWALQAARSTLLAEHPLTAQHRAQHTFTPSQPHSHCWAWHHWRLTALRLSKMMFARCDFSAKSQVR